MVHEDFLLMRVLFANWLLQGIKWCPCDWEEWMNSPPRMLNLWTLTPSSLYILPYNYDVLFHNLNTFEGSNIQIFGGFPHSTGWVFDTCCLSRYSTMKILNVIAQTCFHVLKMWMQWMFICKPNKISLVFTEIERADLILLSWSLAQINNTY